MEEMIMECRFMEAKCRGEEDDLKVMAGNEFRCEWKFPNKLEKIPWGPVSKDSIPELQNRDILDQNQIHLNWA